MAGFSANFTIPGLLAPAIFPLFDLRPSATDYLTITEISGTIVNAFGVALTFGFGTNATAGSVKTNSITWLGDDPNSPLPNAAIGIDWITLPTAPAAYQRRFVTQNVSSSVGCPFLFRFPAGFKLAPSTSAGLWVVASAISVQNPINGINFNLVIDA